MDRPQQDRRQQPPGGSTLFTNYHYGIQMGSNGPTGLAVAINNVVTNTFSAFYAYGIAFPEVSDHNIVRMGVVTSGPNTGIRALRTCRDDTVFDAGAGRGTMTCTAVGHVFTSP